ncbi:EthD domain-containing protein [Sphingomonas profundi]|uniref:EthD domain-containing protein n=1 Tax=Alterirhizorhabdus profundi TaxID=2681549 RepID=UPI0012E79F03|nr:EthD domain-containing protein [Sphingomonas profundi]
MIKVLVFIRRLPHLSREAFIRYYEDHHVPLAERLLGRYYGYRRIYLTDGLYPEGVTSDFDVVTELTFESEAVYDRWLGDLADPEIIRQIREDERHFLDSSYTRMWRVEDHVSPMR